MLDEIIPAGAPWSCIVRSGAVLRITDLEGQQAVDFLCHNAAAPEERYHAPNTMKAAGSIFLTTGHKLYSDIARPIFTIIEDQFGGHDTIGGCCSAPSNQMLYGVTNCPGCRENFLAALSRHELGRRDIVPNINWFMRVPGRRRRQRGRGARRFPARLPGGVARRNGCAGRHLELPADQQPLQ
jgi:uncharacterized protein